MTDHPLSRNALPGLSKRYAKEKRFRRSGVVVIAFSLSFLVFLIGAIAIKGVGAFYKTEVQLTISQELAVGFEGESFSMLRRAVVTTFDASGRTGRREAYRMVGEGSEEDLEAALAAAPAGWTTLDVWITASDDVDQAWKDDLSDDLTANFSDRQRGWLDTLAADGKLRTVKNWGFFTNGDSRDPERAGIGGALMGSIFTLIVCLACSFVVGILAAIYLEEFAKKNKFTMLLEVNINNLATVPSIIFGLLGLAVFINLFGLPRSSPVVGGLVLSLMTLPTIIIASRVSLQAVPPSIREAALGLGATKIQMVFQHVVPLALPGMLTGTILGMARALGETAPLLMIGMIAFIVDPPASFTDPATALPVQVYLWSDSPERAFAEKTSGAILVLLVFLICMNLTAILLRKKLEKKW